MIRNILTTCVLLLVLALVAGCGSQAGDSGKAEADTVAVLPLDTVYITKGGKCYHRSRDCVGRHKPRKVHISYADSIGRRPCENCVGAK